MSFITSVRMRIIEVRDRLKMFLVLSIILLFFHELSHALAQIIFRVPVIVKLYWYGITTNENIISLLATNSLGFYTIVLAGFIGTLLLMPVLKNPILHNIFPDFEKKNGPKMYYIIFLLSAITIAVWDMVFLLETLV
jgi:hypothetical protein